MTDELEGAPETIWTRPRDGRLCLVSYTTKPNPIGDFVAYTRKDIADKHIAELEAVALQTLLEVRNAQSQGSAWYTKGANGLYQQVMSQLDKLEAALKANTTT